MGTSTVNANEGKKRAALGKGIESLLGPRVPSIKAVAEPEPKVVMQSDGKPLDIPVDKIDPNPQQTRSQFDEEKLAELAQSIEASGVVQPIVVRQVGDRYQLIAGERRWRASQKAGKTTIPAILRQVSDEQAMEMTIIENLQREDLNPMEQARAYERLSREFHMTQEHVALRTGTSRASVANFQRLLKLPLMLQQLVESGKLSYGHARALLALEDSRQMIDAGLKVLRLELSVRHTELFVQGLLNPESKAEKPQPVQKTQDPNVREAQERLQRKLGLRVHIEDRNGKGKVVIEYSGVDDFDAILSALGE